jgi:catechol 2,3-dioxygenase-like lactoylglutathione lyase family enzyme
VITGIHHASFTVSDMDRSVAFYRDVLGMRVTSERDIVDGYLVNIVGYRDLHMRIVFLEVGGDSLELIQYLSPMGTPVEADIYNPGMAHLCFAVDNVHEMHERLAKHGVKTRGEPVPIPHGPNKGGFAVYFADPDGFVLEMIQRPAPDPA